MTQTWVSSFHKAGSRPTPPPAVFGYDGAISIQGNKFVNGHGSVVNLKGVNQSGLEVAGFFGDSGASWGNNGPPNWALLHQWAATMSGSTVLINRIPLNSASWLGQKVWKATNSTTWGAQLTTAGNGTADPIGDYKSAVAQTIQSLRGISSYIILELHWGAMQLTLNGDTRFAGVQGQLAFMDVTGFTFWADPTQGIAVWLANNFGSPAFNSQFGYNGGQPGQFYSAAYGGTTGFGDIILELFNEPFLGVGTYSTGNPDLTLLNGGTGNTYITNGLGNITTTVTYTGYQAIVTALRNLNIPNPIVVNGNSYSQQLQNYTRWKPVDPLNQIAFGNHPYSSGAYPYAGNAIFPFVGGDTGGPPQWSTYVGTILAAGFPVIMTEDGCDNGNNAGTSFTQFEPHMSFVSNFCTANNLGYMGWTWGAGDYIQAFNTASANNVMLRQNPTSTGLWPIEGEGWMMYLYLSGNAAPVITTPATLVGANQGTSYNTTLQATGGAGAPFSWTKVSDSGSGLTLSSAGVLSGVLTNTPGTYTIGVTAIDQFGIQTPQVNFSLTVQATVQPPGLPQNFTLTNQNINSQSLSWTAATAGANPIAHYNLYRSVNHAAPVLLASPAGLTFTDSTATNSIQNNTLAPSTVYAYSISAVDNQGLEGPIQTQCSFWLYQNGVANQSQTNFSFSGTPVWNDTTGAPVGGPFDILFNYIGGGSSGFQPCTDTPMVGESFGAEVGAFNFFVVDIKIVDNTHTFFLSHLSRPGYPGGTDYFPWAQAPNFLSNGASAYASPVVNGWVTFKVPLSALSMGISQFHGFIAGTTLTMTHLDSGPGPDSGGYITGPGVAAGTFINPPSGNPSQGGPFPVSVSQTVGSAGAPVALTCIRNNIYKVSLGKNTEATATKLFFNNIGYTVN